MPLPAEIRGAEFIAFKAVFRLFFVTVNFPAAHAFTTGAFVFDKSSDIFRGIAQKQADLMGEFFFPPKTADQFVHAVLRCIVFITGGL